MRITPVRVENRIEENQVTVDFLIEASVFGIDLSVRRTLTLEGPDADALRGSVDAPEGLEPKLRDHLVDPTKLSETAVVADLTQADYDAKIRTDARASRG